MHFLACEGAHRAQGALAQAAALHSGAGGLQMGAQPLLQSQDILLKRAGLRGSPDELGLPRPKLSGPCPTSLVQSLLQDQPMLEMPAQPWVWELGTSRVLWAGSPSQASSQTRVATQGISRAQRRMVLPIPHPLGRKQPSWVFLLQPRGCH